jgi:hypothetical protein
MYPAATTPAAPPTAPAREVSHNPIVIRATGSATRLSAAAWWFPVP